MPVPTPASWVDDDTTRLLRQWRLGNSEAGERALERLYPGLRSLSAKLLAGIDAYLQPSDLLQELYLKIDAQRQIPANSRAHFFALAARLARRLIADHLRHHRRHKRGKGHSPVPLAGLEIAEAEKHPDLLALDQALSRLGKVDPSAVRVVELRYFAGLTVEETAAALAIGPATVVRRWRFARSWLYRELSESRP